jgi:hypothetical protein
MLDARLLPGRVNADCKNQLSTRQDQGTRKRFNLGGIPSACNQGDTGQPARYRSPVNPACIVGRWNRYSVFP